MKCYSLAASAKELGLGTVTKYEQDVFITESMVYCTTFSPKRILELQRIYGTGAVSYCPFPVAIKSTEPGKREGLLVLHEKRSVDTTVANRCVNVLSDITPVKHENSSKLNSSETFRAISSVKMVIVNGSVRESMLYLLFFSATPFIMIGCGGGGAKNIDHLLVMSGMQRLNCKKSSEAEELTLEVYKNLDVVEQGLLNMKKRLNAYFSWIPRLRSFIDVTYKDIDKSRNPGIKLEYSFSPDDYQDDTYYNEMSQQLYTLTTTGGIHLKLCVFKEFTSKDIVILHPWIGILEPIDTDDLTKLLSLPRFRVSLSMCLGLIVHNKKIKSILPKNINASVADFFVVKSTEKIFDYEEWKKDGVVVNLNNTREQMSVLNKEVFMTDNFICSCPVVNSKTVDRVLTMISRCVPVALPKNDLTLPILGEEYPFYMDDPSPYNLRKLSQSDVILRASKYIENNICKRASFIVGEISDTKVGRIAINMTP